MDTRSKAQRRNIMQSVKSRDTGPELAVRRILYSLGYRYRLHVKSLPGTPDIVFSSRKKIILVHGCYWHGHQCNKGRLPKSRRDYWEPKIAANRERDARTESALVDAGWSVLTIWQCEIRDHVTLAAKLRRFLGGTQKNRSPSSPADATVAV